LGQGQEVTRHRGSRNRLEGYVPSRGAGPVRWIVRVLQQRPAAELAIAERNAAKDAKIKVALVKEDSEGNSAKGVAAIDKLISQDKITAFIGEVFSSISLAIEPKVDAAKITMISPSSTSPDLIGKTKYFFRTVADDATQADILGRFVATELKAAKAAILFTKNDYSQGLANAFTAVYEANGGKVVATESGQQGDKDFKTQLTKIKAANPDVIFLPNYVAELAQILEQAAGLGITARFVSADGFSNPSILTTAGKYAEKVLFTASPDAVGDKTAKFQEAYKAKYGEEADDFSKNAYDAANILIDAMTAVSATATDAEKAAGTLNLEAIQAAVAATKDYEGVSGKITFAPDGNLMKNWAIKTVEAGAFKQTAVYKVENNALVKAD
jgi:branched-chain amino acid transport system substrate-binding protein